MGLSLVLTFSADRNIDRQKRRGLGKAWGKERSAEAAPPGKSSQTERQATASAQIFESLQSPGQHSADGQLSESGFCPDKKPEIAEAHPEDLGSHPVRESMKLPRALKFE